MEHSHILLLLVCAVALATANGSRSDDACIDSATPDESVITLRQRHGLYPLRDIRIRLPSLPESTLFALVDIAVSTLPPAFVVHGGTPQDDVFEELEITLHAATPANSTNLQAWMATRYRIYSTLSPSLFDALSLGSLSISERTNQTVLLLPLPVCRGKEESVLQRILPSVLPGPHHDWIVEQLDACTSVQGSEVFLFMSTGLLSIFMVFITLPFAIVTANNCRCCKKRKQWIQLDLYFKAASLISGILFLAFVVYWVLVSVYYYAEDSVARKLFPGLALVPFSINLVFYTLSGTVSFVGGCCFCKCSITGIDASRLSPCQRLGSGLLLLILSTSVYHFFFIVLALFQDATTVTSYLVVFGTVVLLLFLGTCSVIHQYRKTQFRASFGLVLTLKIIIFVLYIISLKAFGSVVLEEDSYTVTPTWLVLVTLLSLCALSFAFSVFILIQKPPLQRNERDERPPVNSGGRSPDLELGVVKSQTELSPQVSVFAVKLPRDLILALPSIINTWRTSKGQANGRGQGRRGQNRSSNEEK